MIRFFSFLFFTFCFFLYWTWTCPRNRIHIRHTYRLKHWRPLNDFIWTGARGGIAVERRFTKNLNFSVGHFESDKIKTRYSLSREYYLVILNDNHKFKINVFMLFSWHENWKLRTCYDRIVPECKAKREDSTMKGKFHEFDCTRFNNNNDGKRPRMEVK